MGRVTNRSIMAALVSIGVSSGCLPLRPIALPLPEPETVATSPASPSTASADASLSGALDGPTLRLALRDLAVILDTLGRLEQVRPDLKSQMLRELADADAATAAAVVKKWRARLPELQADAEKQAAAAARELTLIPRPATESTKAAVPPVPPEQQPEPQDNTNPVTANATADADPIIAECSEPPDWPASCDGEPNLPSWDDLLESLLGLTRDRADQLGPDAVRARIQLVLLELVRRSQENSATMPDPQLWTHLDPAIQYCFANGAASTMPSHEVVRSLQVATELLRGPGRFQLRGLAFCSRIRGFASVDRMEANSFRSGQAVLLYCEVENFFSEPEPGGFRTRISSQLELLDANGRVVSSQGFDAVEDSSSGPRRDYFLSFRFHLPPNLKPGLYSVRLTLRDELANRTASGAIALSIR